MPTVLLMEDEPELSMVVQVRLESCGYRVVAATDGLSGLEKARSELPDVILLDLVMPGMEGAEVFKRLQEMPETKRIPVILFSASHPGRLADHAQQLGAFDSVAKPFEPEELLKKVARAVAKGARKGGAGLGPT